MEKKSIQRLFASYEDTYPGIHKQLEKIGKSLDLRESREKELYIEISNLKKELDEKTTDDRVAALTAQIQDLKRRSVGLLSEQEMEDKDKAYKEHYNTGCNRNPHLELHFTGIGTAYIVKCEKCGFSADISDYNW